MALQISFTHPLTGAHHSAAYARVQVINLRYDYAPRAEPGAGQATAIVHVGVWPGAAARKTAIEPTATHTYTLPLSALNKYLRPSDKGDLRPAVYRWLKARKPVDGEGLADLRKATKV